MSIKMNSKKNKKDNASASNNNNKTKSRIINMEGEIITTNNTVKKQKKKENNLSHNENIKAEPAKVGRKRKQTDVDVEFFPTPKKPRKKAKEQTSLNNTSAQDVAPSGANNGDVKREPEEETMTPKKTKKKNKVAVNEPNSDSSIDQNNISMDVLETSVEKVNKRKSKPNQTANASVKGTNSLDSLGDTNEVFPMNYTKMEIQDTISDIDIKEELLRNDDVVNITIKDLDTDSDSSDAEVIETINLDKKVVKRVKRPEALKRRKAITWPEEDLKTLVDRMETCVPENDVLAFSTRAEKLEWDMVAFNNYTVEECKTTWFLMQKQIRKFRLLKEVLADAKDWINLPKNQKNKACRHPDMPRKPLTAYFIFYLKKKDVFHKAHPGLDATEISKILGQEFKNLPPDKRMKYENLAATKKMEYLQKMNEFYQKNPDIPRIIRAPRLRKNLPKRAKLPKSVKVKPSPKPPKERIPKRPPPPFQYYYLSELKTRKENGEEIDKLLLKEQCKEQWRQLADKKKLVWINFAEAEYAKYKEELKTYEQSHPDYVHNHQKSILTKEEIQLKERVAGKPSKPPGSAYNLFARMLLQSDEIKSVPIRDRLNFVSNQWKNCAEEEKKQYRDLSTKMNEKYKLDFASYLETLPEEERRLELQKSLPKRRKSEDAPKKGRPPKKRKILKKLEKKTVKKPERKTVAKKLVEPEQPPISAYKYFVTLYTGEEPAAQAWKALTSEQKKIYEEELVKKKQAYIVDFEKFLKSLTKEELEAFSNSRRQIKDEPDDDDDLDDDDDEEETSDESGTEVSDADSNNQEDSELV